MQSAGPQGSPQADTGLPPGVHVGPVGARFLAQLLDSVLPGIVGVALQFLLPSLTGGARLGATVAGLALTLGWAVFVWHSTAVHAASPGMRVLNLQVVGFYDGRPIGWGRVLLRALIFGALALTGIGLLIMLVLLLTHPRKQGWHDRAVQAVVIKARALAPKEQPADSAGGSGPVSTSVAAAPTGTAPVAAGSAVAASAATPGAPVSPAPPTTQGPEIENQPGSRVRSPYAPPVAGPPEAPPVAQEWVAKLDDGREIVVEGLVLLGRNPQPKPGEEDAQLIKLADETRTVSKSHLGVGLDANGLYVVDRGSTNGSVVTAPNGVATRARAGDVIPVAPGSIVSMGDHWMEISRRPVQG